jgi:CDGSH-type Zn-finger protein
VRTNGPYLVQNAPVRRKRMVVSEHGEPLTWQSDPILDAGDDYVLCRCGGSSTKPFCDGSHKEIGFDGTESAPATSYDERARAYEGSRIVMRDDRSICEHAGFCGNRATNVWKLLKGDATEDSIARAEVIAMIEHCPSGALTYRLEPDGDDVEPDLRPGVGVVDDGPLFVTGGITITRSDGTTLELRNRVTLCRCGGSANKPLCDGSHKENGFRDRGTS